MMAGDRVTFLRANVDETTHAVTFSQASVQYYTVVSNQTEWGGSGTISHYVVNSDVTIDDRITVTGTVNLILCDGATLRAKKGITVADDDKNPATPSPNVLNIVCAGANSNGDGATAVTDAANNKNYKYAKITFAPLDPVSYLKWDDTAQKLVEQTGDDACKVYTEVSIQTAWGKANTETWFVVNAPGAKNLTISDRITVTGTVNLILCDGAQLTAKAGITVADDDNNPATPSPNVLNIYEGWTGTRDDSPTVGSLYAGCYMDGTELKNSCPVFAAGIGGGDKQDNGTVTIHGGTVTATGGQYGAGIGGGKTRTGGTVSIHGGTVTATGGQFGAGIGGCIEGSGGSITIHGGTVTATGGFDGAGIGGGKNRTGGTVTIHGGTVTATGGQYGAGIGGGWKGTAGSITITGGTVEAYGNKGGNSSFGSAGIGAGQDGNNGENDHIVITGGTVTASVPVGTKGAAIGNGGGSGTDVAVTIGADLRAKAGTTETDSKFQTDVTTVGNKKEYKWVRIDVHTHDFTYTASGAAITARCVDGCDITEGLTLTLSAPGGTLTYDGSEKAATLSTGYDTTAFPGQYAITYTKDGEAFTGTPRGAGSYTASVTVGDATASVSFTIAPKQVGLQWSNTKFTYDGKTHVPTATATGLVDGDTCTVTVSGAQSKAGTYTATASSLDNPNYKLSGEATQSFTVAQKAVGLQWSNTKFTCDGKAHAPTAKATELVKGDTCTVTVSGAQSKAGTFTATASGLDNPNYRLPSAKTTKFTIARAAQTAPAAPVVTKTTGSSITVKTNKGMEYRISGSGKWQKGGTFQNLTPGRQYTIYARRAADGSHSASPAASSAARTLSAAILLQNSARISEKGKTITVKFGKVPTATAYDIYVQYCGEEFAKKPTVTTRSTSVSITKLAGKSVDTSKNCKVNIVARSGKNVLGKTTDLHAVASGRQRSLSDPTGLSVSKASITLQKGRSAGVGAKLEPKTGTLSGDHCAALRYVTSDSHVASVDRSGKITAKGAGVCTIQVIAFNGLSKTVIVTVK